MPYGHNQSLRMVIGQFLGLVKKFADGSETMYFRVSLLEHSLA
jgi:hypothetical protein